MAADNQGDLGEFEGHDVLGTSLKITNTGDGLSKAMATDPQMLHHGDEVCLVIRGEVVDVQFPPVKDTDGVQRKHVVKAGTVTIVDEALVAEVLAEQDEANLRAAEAAAGVSRIPFTQELEGEHNRGEHADELAEGCPSCEDEVAKAAEEAGDEDSEAQ